MRYSGRQVSQGSHDVELLYIWPGAPDREVEGEAREKMVVEGGYAGRRQDAYMYGYKAGKAVVECIVTDRSGRRRRSKQAMIISEYVGGKRN